ncbi:MAG: hypothetical protein EXQ47_02615 [Bryobacterales bacterium]|nr:hypothetical protein [Bryobacterales bacterium]
MWLLDANMDVHLVRTLNQLGVSCDTAANRGWKALANGELVAAAVAAGFTCLLTRDQLFGESAARALNAFSTFGVVVVDLPQQRWQAYQEHFLAAWGVRPIEPVAGALFHRPQK